MFAPVVWLRPVVDVASALNPLFRVKLLLNGNQVVTDAQGQARETTLPAWVSIRKANTGKHIPPTKKKTHTQTSGRILTCL